MTYTIQDRSEETECRYCGCPLRIGDKVTTDEGETYAYCSDACFNKLCSRCGRSGILDTIGNERVCQGCQYKARSIDLTTNDNPIGNPDGI